MSQRKEPPDGDGLGPTRVRDVLVVAVFAAIGSYALIRLNYSSLPKLPRFAGATAALIGIVEAVVGIGVWRRMRAWDDELTRLRQPHSNAEGPSSLTSAATAASAHSAGPVPPLLAARLLAVAKATALAGAALAGLWLGFGIYLLPRADRITAAQIDLVTSIVGLVAALLMMAGALVLERCCQVPRHRTGPSD